MSSSISIFEHVKLADKPEQAIKQTQAFKEPLEGRPGLVNRVLCVKSERCHRLKSSQETEHDFEVNALRCHGLLG